MVIQLIKEGRLDRKEITFDEFSTNFWVWDKCSYLESQRLRGKILTRKYADNQRTYLVNHILPVFRGMKLGNIKPFHIEKWLRDLVKEGRLSGATINHCYGSLRIMFREANRQQLITTSPMDSLRPVIYRAPERVILTLEEAKAILDETRINEFWPDEITYTASLLAATTGMRQGEVLALRIEDIHEGYITIAHSWDHRYGLGSTKTRKIREIPLTSKAMKWLTRIVAGRQEGFIFSLDGGGRPIYYRILTKALYKAFEKIGITKSERLRRHLNFHAWRHFFNSIMRGKIPDPLLRQLTGHSTEQMTEHYSHFRLEDFKPVVAIQENLGI